MAEPSAKSGGRAERSGSVGAPALDELMMAMDVVDTLRHEERMVAKDLAQKTRDETLKARLRELYEAQGLEVSDRILEEGIQALKDQRFVYTPPEPGWRVWLARLWVDRDRYGYIGGVAVLLIAGWLTWSMWAGSPEERLAASVAELSVDATALATTAAAREAIVDEQSAADRALAAGALDIAEEHEAALKSLKYDLGLAYDLRIVNTVGEPSGVFRIPDVNQAARNYYLIVEAIDPNGVRLTRPVMNEETGKTLAVKKWGIRVPEPVFRAVAADKQDDGIIQDDIVGTKTRGRLGIEHRMPVLDGAITEW